MAATKNRVVETVGVAIAAKPLLPLMPQEPVVSSSIERKRTMPAKRKRAASNSNTSPAKADQDNDVAATGMPPPAAAAAVPEAPAEKPKRGRRKLLHDEDQRNARRKMQCKLNQRRYRARQRGMISTLSLETEKLTDYIRELESYKRFLARVTSPDSHWDPLVTVKRYFKMFRHGFTLHSAEISDLQESFVRFVLDTDVVSQGTMDGGGVDAFLLQLKRYTSYHAVFEMLLTSARVVYAESISDPSSISHTQPRASIVHAMGKMRLRLSRDTVMLVYPHVVGNESISNRVVGHEIEPTMTLAFHFNDKGKVCKFEMMVDFTSAFVKLLQSVEDTATLLDGALISPFSELGINPSGSPSPEFNAGSNKQLSLKFILL